MKQKLIPAAIIITVIVAFQQQVCAQWQLTGNAGTTPGSNFIGTTDLKALVFKTNNQKSGRIDCSGPWNVSLGFQSMLSPTGDNNAAFGLYALKALTTGYCNIALGNYSLTRNTTGLFNTGLGYGTLSSNTTGYYNVAAGGSALSNNTTGRANVAVGYGALVRNSTLSNLVAVGDSALYNFNGSSYGWNTAIGSKALFATTTGWGNVATGDNVLYSNNGHYNSGYGHLCLYGNTTGAENVGFGAWALSGNSTGNDNAAFGSFSMIQNSTGNSNTAVGVSAMYFLTTGSYNTSVGQYSGASVVSFTNSTSIGYNASADASNKVRIGNTSVNSIGGQVGWTSFSDARVKKDIKQNVPGLAFIKLLKPSTYRYDIKKENELLGVRDSAEWIGKADLERISFTGFLAQEVDEAAKKIGYEFSGVDKTGKLMGLRYAEFTVPLVKAVQELSQQNDDLRSGMQQLQSEIEELKALVRNTTTSAKGNTETAINAGTASVMQQNMPNPCDNSTKIKYQIAPQAKHALLKITTAGGQELKTFVLNQKGNGEVQIDAAAFVPGTYQYSLIVDGKIAESKTMVVVH